MIYANNAGTSWPKPAPVAEAVERALMASPAAWGQLYEEALGEVTSFFGIRQRERFLFTSSCTSALDLVFASLPWSSGDRIVASHLEHHALSRHLVRLSRDLSVASSLVAGGGGAPIDLDAMEEELRRGGVRLVACTMASNVTGELLPVEEIVALAHRYGALCLVDGAQCAGLMPIDVEALGADLFVFAGHKGPLGPQGVGGFYAAPHVAMSSPSASCDIDSFRRGDAGSCSPFPSFCDVGSVNLAGVAGLAAGLCWLGARPVSTLSHARPLSARLIKGVLEMGGFRIMGSAAASTRVPLVSLTSPRHTPARMQSHLQLRHIVARGGMHCAPLAHDALGTNAHGTLRLSFGAFNTERDVDAILAALEELER